MKTCTATSTSIDYHDKRSTSVLLPQQQSIITHLRSIEEGSVITEQIEVGSFQTIGADVIPYFSDDTSHDLIVAVVELALLQGQVEEAINEGDCGFVSAARVAHWPARLDQSTVGSVGVRGIEDLSVLSRRNGCLYENVVFSDS